ncbi:MAG: type III-B CRISPR module RAMP protein Cmr1 [Bacteroidota bacterium]
MNSITFTCETITPMFLAGADGRTPELRAPSIKGAMRFWWRAMHGHLPLNELKAEEDKIFGGTDRRSSVILTARYVDENINNHTVPKFNYIRDYKENKIGVRYFNVLFYFHDKDREGIAPGVRFEIKLRSQDKSHLIKAATTFWLFSILGGLGSRSRRGNGSFRIIRSKRNGLNSSELPFYKKNREGKYQIGDIRTIKEVVAFSKHNDFVNFSHLQGANIFYSKGISRGKGFDKWHDAVHDIAFKMMQVRDSNTKYDQGRNIEKFTMDDIDKKAAFGLPFNILGNGSVNLFLNNQGDYIDTRRASPLIVSLTKIGKNLYWTATFLQGIFMPENASIIHVDRNGKKRMSKEKESTVLVEEFKERLRNEWMTLDEIFDAELEGIVSNNSNRTIKFLDF